MPLIPAKPSDLPVHTRRSRGQPTYRIEKKEARSTLQSAFESRPGHREAQ